MPRCVRAGAVGTLGARGPNMLRSALLGIGLLAALPGARAAEPLRDLAYAHDAAEQRLELYLPEAGDGKPPLVAFVSSRFWSREGDVHLLEWGVARPLQRAGAAVALIHHRLAPEHRHPVFARDVAAAVASEEVAMTETSDAPMA